MTLFFVLALVGGLATAADKPIAGDAEAAKHGFEAADVRVIHEENLPGFIFRQFDLAVLSHYSYLVGSGGEALVVDPARDVDVYVQTAKDLGLKITGSDSFKGILRALCRRPIGTLRPSSASLSFRAGRLLILRASSVGHNLPSSL